jgi:hypothetical protein
MKYLAALSVAIFLILFITYCVVQCYVLPISNNTSIETFRGHIDITLRNAWIRQDVLARGLYSTIFRNRDKLIFFPPRITPQYSVDRKIQGYISYGMVKTWDAGKKLLTLSSYTGGILYVRFDPDTYEQKAIFMGSGISGDIETTKPVKIITNLSISNIGTLFCENDVFSIETATWRELFFSTPDHPVVPRELMLSFYLCQNKP